jgi:hypothetical protein
MDSLDVSAILSHDLQSRSDAEVREKDTFLLETITSKKWDYNLPTMILHSSFMETPISDTILTDSNEVAKKFYSNYPILEGVDMSNILVAGGSICNIIIGYDVKTDIDLFIYGMPLDNVSERINKFIRDINLIDRRGKVVKSKYATTIIIASEDDTDDIAEYANHGYDSELIIQIIHRLYETPSQVLHGFDNGACSVGLILNGGSKDANNSKDTSNSKDATEGVEGTEGSKDTNSKVITTGLGRVALEYKINIWDNRKRGMAYEGRLCKYFERGFDIVFPNLDIEKVKLARKNDALIKLMKVSFDTYRVIDNKIFCKGFTRLSGNFSDYAVSTAHMNVRSNSKSNISKLLKGDEPIYFKVWQGKEDLLSTINDNSVVHPTKEFIKEHFDNITFFDGKKVDVGKLKLYLKDSYKELIMRSLEVENAEELNKEICTTCVEKVISLLEAYINNGGYVRKWRVLDPGAQLDGSFHPENISLEDFYGSLLKE